MNPWRLEQPSLPIRRRRYVILDRDGTINVERHYLADPALVELLPGTIQGLRCMRTLGLGLIVVTNQSGIGRWLFNWPCLDSVHQRLCELLSAAEVSLDGIYVCPHRPESQCDCRKPKIGLVERAAREIGFDLADCFVIGDKASDIELGQRVGATTILVQTGYGAQEVSHLPVPPDYVVENLWDAAQVIERALFLDIGAERTMQG
jgi:D-glycero-D-manno-heptose 1,7-bisphosphate phosphatase